MLREVEGDEVPVPHFGVILDENQFLRAAARLKQAGWCFVILHTNASGIRLENSES